MSYETRFSFAHCLSSPMDVPAGTISRIEEQIRSTEKSLGFQREKYLENPERWVTHQIATEIDDEVACEAVSQHNGFVDWLWDRLGEWSKQKPSENTEVFSIEKSADLFPFLVEITLFPERWTANFYQAEMDKLYEVMRGKESGGISFDAKPLSVAQADAVVRLFAGILDTHDIRLAVPKDRDDLRRSDDGGYSWCDKCFRAIAEDDIGTCRKRKCPLNEEARHEA